MRILLQWSILACALCASAPANVITSVHCGLSSHGSHDDPANTTAITAEGKTRCSLGDVSPYVEASVTRIGQFGAWTSVTGLGAERDGVYTTASASALFDITATIATPGPIRPGYVTFFFDFETGGGEGNSPFPTTSVTFGPYTFWQIATDGFHRPTDTPPVHSDDGRLLYPIVLGMPISLEAQTSVGGEGTWLTSLYDSTVVKWSFTLLEANQGTPVDYRILQDVPEPSTALLLFPSALALGFWKIGRAVRRAR